MTPDQRMQLFNLVAEYDDSSDAQSGLVVLYKITEFVEKLEYDAAHANAYPENPPKPGKPLRRVGNF